MTDASLDLDIAMDEAVERAYSEWRPVADVRDGEFISEECRVLEELEWLEDDAVMDELAILLRGPHYRAYLSTRTWRIRAYRAKRWGYCWRCGRNSAHLDAHHLTYERLGRERSSDLIALCRTCHGAVHGRGC